MHKILIVDDEQDIVDVISFNMQKEGYEVLSAANGLEAVEVAKLHTPQLILLDMNMPLLNGLQTCNKLRQIPGLHTTSIVFLTAQGSDSNELLALDAGADDFLRKPITMPILKARVSLILKRYQKPSDSYSSIITVDNLIIDKQAFKVLLDGTAINLARKEFLLLELLASQPQRVWVRQEILDKIWGTEVIVGDRTIDVHIRKIRQKLNDKFIHTIKGIGYKLQP
jgi:two-component system, OmpR family, alkaline phosphatase synthesis response regulator PhoP